MTEKYRDLTVTDNKTGEVLDRLPIYCPKKLHSSFSTRGFSSVAHDALIMLAESDLDGVTIKVLIRLIASMGMENLIAVNQSELAKGMGLHKSNFSKAVRTLLEREIIIENSEKIGRTKTYRLNPNYAWRGSTKNHIEAIENYEDNRTKSTKVSKTVEAGNVTVTLTATIEQHQPVGNSTN